MKEVEKRAAAKMFAKAWEGKGDEIADTQTFWLTFLRDVLGISHAENALDFEKRVVIDGNTKRIDAYISETRTLIEQKSIDKSLNRSGLQSGGAMMTPYEQAKNYAINLPSDEYPRWIITCNFKEFEIHNMNRPGEAPTKILLSELPKRFNEFGFLIDSSKDQIRHETEVSVKAGELVGKIYDAFLKQYPDRKDPQALHSLNVLCVRLVFCLYAEDADIFGRRDMFHDYLSSFRTENMRMGLIELFKTLDTKIENRDPFAEEKLLEFPYVNGGLFSDAKDIMIPPITEEIRELLLDKASSEFDWSEISPTIFGAVFESTLNPGTRRSGGMHYTSIENIHKVIDPLFLDSFTEEFEKIKQLKDIKTKRRRLEEFQNKLAAPRFLDPAAGSGNFCTESYLSLRRLENKVIAELINLQKGTTEGQIIIGEARIYEIKVSIQQFYGIEINDFAVTVAGTALWIAEAQMLKETEDVMQMNLDFLPLKPYDNIAEGNALRMDWNNVVPASELSYIMGNPPFVGGMYMSKEQKKDIVELMPEFNGVGELDYVAGWYKKAIDYIENTEIEAAFVSTNSICQGQQATTLWQELFKADISINFAHRTFIWDSEASAKAHVHCIIVGFAMFSREKKTIFEGNNAIDVSRINSYLMDAPEMFVTSRGTPVCDVPRLVFGSMPRDGGGFILTEEEKEEFIRTEPLSEQWIKLYLGANEFLKKKKRYCLWLLNADPAEIKQCKRVCERVKSVKEFRLASKAAGTRKFAETPALFCQIAQPEEGNYIAVPETSSEKRKYIPMGFLPSEVIASNLLFLIPGAELYHFGVLESNVHMAWMRAFAGRLKSDYRYSKDIVYNTFPWPNITSIQKSKIEGTAQAILDARNMYPEASLADLYDELTMPIELRNAHRANDKAVWEAYGKAWDISSESECVAFLMKKYQELTQ